MTESTVSGELLRRVHRLQIRCASLVDQGLAGAYDSTFKGRGLEFEETRPYANGDDVRAIDWRVTARTGRPHVKRFREERQLTIQLVVDASRSLDGPGPPRTARHAVREMAGIFAVLAARENDRVGLTLFTDRVEHHLAPEGGMAHVFRVLRDVCGHPCQGTGTDLTPPLERLVRTERKRCVAILLSDFLCSGFDRALRIASRFHEIIPVVIREPADEWLPSVGLLRATDPESGQPVVIDTSSRRQREAFRAAAERQRQSLERRFARLRIPPLRLSPRDDVVAELQRYFDARRRRGESR
jgi:uncharacterized protein (DUF58 family)